MRFPKLKSRGGGSKAGSSSGSPLPRFSLISRGSDMKDKTFTTNIRVESVPRLECSPVAAASPTAAKYHDAGMSRDDDEGGREKEETRPVAQSEMRDAPPVTSPRSPTGKSPRLPRSPKSPQSTKSMRSGSKGEMKDTPPTSPRSPQQKETSVASPARKGGDQKEKPSTDRAEITHATSSLTIESDDIINIHSKRSTVVWEDPEEDQGSEPEADLEVELEPIKSSLEKAANTFKRKKKKTLDESELREKHRKACKHLKLNNLEMAQAEFEEILAMLIKHYGEHHRRVGAALHNVGIVHIRAGHLDDAIDAIEEAVRLRKETLGDDHPKVADSLVELGITLLSQQEHEDSLEIFNEALEMREREAADASVARKPQCTIQVAKILNNLGCVYFEFGALNDALKTFEEALDIQRDAMEEIKEDNPSYDQASLALASTLCNIGYVNMESSDYEEAVEVLDEAYAIQASILEFGNSLTLNTLENLAYSNAMNWNNRAALKFYEEMLTDESEAHGSKSLTCASTRINIAAILFRMCQFERALNHLVAAEEIQVSKLSPKSRRLEKTREMIGCVRYEMLKFPTPAEFFNRTMTRGGVHNPITQKLLCSCGDGEVNEMDSKQFSLSRPQISSKMSGHKVSYA